MELTSETTNLSRTRRLWQYSLSQLLAWITLAAAICCVVSLVGEELFVLMAVVGYFVVVPLMLLVYVWPLAIFAGLILALQALCFVAIRRGRF